MAVQSYNVVIMTYSTADELETLLDAQGANEWELVSAVPGPPNAATGEATITCIFKGGP